MLIGLIKGSAVLALILAASYGLLRYLARVDFEPAAPSDSSSQLRIGEWLLDIPQPLEIRHYHVQVEIGGQVLFLSESLAGPPDLPTDAAGDRRDEKAREPLVTADLRLDLDQAASMEATFRPAGQGPGECGRLLRRVLMPQDSGFLALDSWLEVPDEAQESRGRLKEIIRDHQSSLISQVKTVLSGYRWLGSGISEKPEGFMTRYGLLRPDLKSFQVSAGVNLSHGDGGVPVQFLFAIRAGTGPRPVDPFDSHPSFYNKVKYLLKLLTGEPLKMRTGSRPVNGKTIHESEIFFYDRLLNRIHTRMICSCEPVSGGPGSGYLSGVFITNGFIPSRAPEFLGLWRQVLDSAR